MADSIFCPQCGFTNGAERFVCANCGAGFRSAAPPNPPAWQQAPYPGVANPYEAPTAKMPPSNQPYAGAYSQPSYPAPPSNPYANVPAYGLPQPLVGYAPEVPIWNNGSQLVCARAVSLPHFCVKCDAPGTHRLTKKLYWNPPWVVLMLLINVIVYLVVALATRKTVVMEFSLCERHANLRRNILIGGWLSLALCPAAWILAGMNSSVELFWVGTLFLLGALGCLIGQRYTMPVPTKMDDRFGWFKGVCDAFRSRLPFYP